VGAHVPAGAGGEPVVDAGVAGVAAAAASPGDVAAGVRQKP
jgi:hypothetical protein